jgi:putative nucleotidyltransferase with HDIG domain
MRRQASIYLRSVSVLGLAVWVGAIVSFAPWDHFIERVVQPGTLQVGLILLALTVLSTLSPVPTRGGGHLSVGIAPLFAAIVFPLPPWVVMTLAGLGTMDQRIPGKQIPWDLFLFNRGQFILTFGLPSILVNLTLHAGTASTVLPMFAAAGLIYLINTALMSTSIALVRGVSVVAAARTALWSNALTWVGLPLIGILIAHLLQGNGHLSDELLVFLLYGPLLIYRTSIQKQNRLDTWLRDSYIMQSRVVDKRDGQTFGHSQRVGELCESVAHLLRLTEEACNTIRIGGVLHDLGKIAIPDSILLKPSKLTPEEYEIIKTHPAQGAQILAEHPEQKEVAEIVMHHHERWDGKGYPAEIKGQAIPIGSRIVNACDAFDTITQARVFRPTVRTPAEAIRELRELAGSWYDPDVITALEQIVAQRWGVEIRPALVPAPAPAPSFRDVLAIRPFRLLWVGQAVSYFGDMMNLTGLAIMLYFLTHSPSIVALGLITKAAPTALLGLVAGPVVDRFNRQRLMVTADLIRGLLTVTIPFLAVRWLPGVFVAVFLIATASAFFNPAKQAIVPNLVPERHLVRANSLISSSEKTMELLGFSLAGVIAATISWLPLFLIDSATYLVSAATLLGVPDRLRAHQTGSLQLARDIREGSRFIFTNRILRSTMALTLFAAILGGVTFPLLVVFAIDTLGGGPFGYGILEAAIGAGAVVGALSASAAMARWPAGILILAGVAGTGGMAALTGFSRSLWIAAVFLLLSGLANTVYYVSLVSVTQRQAPDRIRGRVMSTRFLVVQVGLLAGMAVSGPLTTRLGAPIVFVLVGVLLLLAAAFGAAFPDLRDARLHEDEPSRELKVTAAG